MAYPNNMTREEMQQEVIKKLYALKTKEYPKETVQQIITRVADCTSKSPDEIVNIIFYGWQNAKAREDQRKVQQQMNKRVQALKDQVLKDMQVAQQEKEKPKFNFKNEPDNKIKQAQNIIELPNNVKLLTYFYDDQKKMGFEILMDSADVQTDEGRKRITEALQALMEYIMSLE